jgi:predicted kinase
MADNRPTLTFLCGLPFAGKSTLAQVLADQTDARLIALDAINSERGLGLDGNPISPRQWDMTYAMAYQRVEVTLAARFSVVYDETNFLRSQRDAVRAIAGRVGATVRLIWVTTPEAIGRARWLANRQTGARFDVRDEDFTYVATRFEEPEPDEDALRYDGVQPPEEWLAAVGLIGAA